MNIRMAVYILGVIAMVEGFFMVPSLIYAGVQGEAAFSAFAISVAVLLAAGAACAFPVRRRMGELQARDGLLIVGLSWVELSLFGALPYVLSGMLPNYIDAVFETASGFTTTGATVLTSAQIDLLNVSGRSLLLWRSMTHWMGGMGVLVFIIAILPRTDARIMHLFRAESPGPQVGKLVSRLRFTARILYGIYIFMTLVQIVLLSFRLPLYDSVIHAFGTASTGGFSNLGAGVAGYDSVYVDVVITVFMFLFSLNFNLYFLILLGKVRSVLRSEELRVFSAVVLFSMLAIALNLVVTMRDTYETFGEALRYAAFQTVSVISTTGFVTADFSVWPAFSQTLLMVLMFIGGCAGSTAGGLKVSRVILLFKSGLREMRRALSPREIAPVKLDGKLTDNTVVTGVQRYLVLYLIVFAVSAILVAIANPHLTSTSPASYTIEPVTGVISCLNNVGPALGVAFSSYADFSLFSKVILTFDMLAGRLELLPMLVLFTPAAWKRG